MADFREEIEALEAGFVPLEDLKKSIVIHMELLGLHRAASAVPECDHEALHTLLMEVQNAGDPSVN